MSLRIANCSYESSKFAVLNWHYSKTMPASKLIKYGVWENKKFIGTVIYGRGANQHVPKSLGLKMTECCELTRVALNKHITPTTRIIAITLRLLKKQNKDLKKVFSYADWTNQKHKGTIYKAGNWKYQGARVCNGGHYIVNNKIVHNRTLNGKYGSTKNYPKSIKKAQTQTKYFFTYDL